MKALLTAAVLSVFATAGIAMAQGSAPAAPAPAHDAKKMDEKKDAPAATTADASATDSKEVVKAKGKHAKKK